MTTGSHVWYASYGSNLLEERFLCYIRGGQPPGSSTWQVGCRDKTLPTEKRAIAIHHQLYFARQSESWGNGGVAFLSIERDSRHQTLGRMYRITTDQFIDVIRQENDLEGTPEVDLEKTMTYGSLVFIKTNWYGRLLYLGNQSGVPIFTFTSETDLLPYSKPDRSYLNTIVNGLRESYTHFTSDTIVQYLISKPGVANCYSEEELQEFVQSL